MRIAVRFEASLNYKVRPYLKKLNKTTTKKHRSQSERALMTKAKTIWGGRGRGLR